MPNDDDDTLRDALTRIAPTVDVADGRAAVDRKVQRLRRRQLAASLGAVATVIAVSVAIAVGAFAGASHGHLLVPAAPSTSTAEPSVSTSTTPSPASTATSIASTTTTVSSAPDGVAPPTVHCPTQFGLEPRTRTVPAPVLPVDLARRVAWYADQAGIDTALAPRGWQCTAVIGADGTGRMEVTPPGTTSSQQGDAVIVSDLSACVGCAFNVACGFFEMPPALVQGYGACPATPPAREIVTKRSATAVEFEDPPGVHGNGDPSGGPDTALGVVLYTTDVHIVPWKLTCTLPAADRDICRAAVADLEARHPMR